MTSNILERFRSTATVTCTIKLNKHINHLFLVNKVKFNTTINIILLPFGVRRTLGSLQFHQPQRLLGTRASHRNFVIRGTPDLLKPASISRDYSIHVGYQMPKHCGVNFMLVCDVVISFWRFY